MIRLPPLTREYLSNEGNKLTYSVLLWTVISIDLRRTLHPPEERASEVYMLYLGRPDVARRSRKSKGIERGNASTSSNVNINVSFSCVCPVIGHKS